MRINQFVARASGLSRRAADEAITSGRIKINSITAKLGQEVLRRDSVTFDGQLLIPPNQTITIMLNKPVGYVVSRRGQGSKTIYELLPPEFQNLKPAGRLDKDSSGLLLLTNDGQLAQELTHPKFAKQKIYEIELNKSLASADQTKIKQGVELEDGLSKLRISDLSIKESGPATSNFRVAMSEGRKRQIRRTFAALGYEITTLHRIQFGDYRLNMLQAGNWKNA